MSLKAWTNHVDGSIALLNLRGTGLLDSEFGSAIFTQARTQIVCHAFFTSINQSIE